MGLKHPEKEIGLSEHGEPKPQESGTLRRLLNQLLRKASTIQTPEEKPTTESLYEYFFPKEGHRGYYTGYGTQHFSFAGNPVAILSGDPGDKAYTGKLEMLCTITDKGVSRSKIEEALRSDAVIRHADSKYRKIREIRTDELKVWTTGAGAER